MNLRARDIAQGPIGPERNVFFFIFLIQQQLYTKKQGSPLAEIRCYKSIKVNKPSRMFMKSPFKYNEM